MFDLDKRQLEMMLVAAILLSLVLIIPAALLSVDPYVDSEEFQEESEDIEEPETDPIGFEPRYPLVGVIGFVLTVFALLYEGVEDDS